MKLRELFKSALKAALSGNFEAGFGAADQLNRMAQESHEQAHRQAMLDHQHHMDVHMHNVQHFNDFHMMGPHF